MTSPTAGALMDECRENCAQAGDKPCFVLPCWDPDNPDWCKSCLAAVLGEQFDEYDDAPLDDAAVVRPLL